MAVADVPRARVYREVTAHIRANWDMDWKRCPECPAPVIPGLPHGHLNQVVDEMMAERIGVPSEVLARTVYGGSVPPDPIDDIRLAQEKLDALYARPDAAE